MKKASQTIPIPSMFRRLSVSRVIYILFAASIVSLMLFAKSNLRELMTVTGKYTQRSAEVGVVVSSSQATGSGSLVAGRPAGNISQDTLKFLGEQKCVLPSLQVNDPQMMSFVHKPAPLKCPQETPDWVSVRNGTLIFSEHVKGKNVSCDLSPLIRPDDDNRITWGPRVADIPDGYKMPSDFVKVECRQQLALPGSTSWRDILIGVSPQKTNVWKRLEETKPQPNGLSSLSVLMMGFDSMSRMSWHRRLPASRQYMSDVLGGIELEGYNIMGDGTPAALFPILTGKHESELPESRRNHRGARPVDDYPWIWKDFQKVGYVTSWADAEPNIGPFNYRLLGFRKQPTDYFLRPYFMGINEQRKAVKRDVAYCRGPRPAHQVWFDFAKDLYHMYGNSPKFMMHFYTPLSHDKNDPITMADEDLKSFLEYLETSGYLNQTILVLFGDHGARYSHLRATWSGKLEERLPYMTWRFPPWFQQKYPQLVRNFRTNARRLTSPLDIHETLHDVIQFDGSGTGDIRNRGISLFKEIPAERTCREANISNHWCACLNWKHLTNPSADAGAMKAVNKAVSVINGYTEPHRVLCAKLEVANVSSVARLEADTAMLQYKAKNDYQTKYNTNIKQADITYQVTFTTNPGGGNFEVTVNEDKNGNMTVSEKEISRINLYGDQPYCILDINRQVRQYCYCDPAKKPS